MQRQDYNITHTMGRPFYHHSQIKISLYKFQKGIILCNGSEIQATTETD